jgi:large subunit ribosomal protein L23
MHKHSGHILLSPRITEKGALMAEKGAYVFNVAKNASKKEVAVAIKEVYNVSPVKVNLSSIKGKAVMTRGTNKMGKTASGKKAYVFLKSGDKIELA